MPCQKKWHTFSRCTQIYSWRAGVNIYLQFLEKLRKGLYLMSSPSIWDDYWTLVFVLFSVRTACWTYYSLLLLLKCLGRKIGTILVTHVVWSQSVFGHKRKIRIYVCVTGVEWSMHKRTHLLSLLISMSSFTVNIQPSAGNHLVFWSWLYGPLRLWLSIKQRHSEKQLKVPVRLDKQFHRT